MNFARTSAVAIILSALVPACGDAGSTGTGASAAPSAKAAAATTAKASASGAAPAVPATVAAATSEPKEVTGKALLEQLKLPAGSTEHPVPNMDGFAFRGPGDAKLSPGGAGRSKAWGTVSAGGKSAALLVANHEQDEGEKCMKLADAKAKLAGAKIVRELSLTSSPEEVGGKNVDHGETIELVVFERDGKQGFYAHKEFDHGDDSTHVCCAAGAPADAKGLTGTADAATVDALSAVCLSTTFSF